MKELTLRGCLLAVVLTVVLTAANVYLGLEVGLTFNTSIPAAVISLSLLRAFQDATIREHCTVQTFTSAAGTLSNVIFVIPAFLLIGYWSDVNIWQVTVVCIAGGLLGIVFSVPLRRSLVVKSDLPFPEGSACANILRAGASDEKLHVDAKPIWHGVIWASVFTLFSKGFHIFATGFHAFFNVGDRVFGVAATYSSALLGAGYLIGIRVGLSILLGVVIAWVGLVPYFSHVDFASNTQSMMDLAYSVWQTKARYFGVGVIAFSALWAIINLTPSLIKSVGTTLHQHKTHKHVEIERIDRDLSLPALLIIGLCSIVIVFAALFLFTSGSLHPNVHLLIILASISTVFVLLIGFLVASASGYMAGLVGSSTSPLSSLAIIAIILASYLVLFLVSYLLPLHDVKEPMMGLSLLLTAFVLTIASIANDNLQDLKTGQLVGATPWRQQIALVFGVFVGSAVIPWVITLVYHAYGFVGAPSPNAHVGVSQALAAPQAALIAELVKGIIGGEHHWNLIIWGVGIGFVLTLIGIFYKRFTLSIFAIGIGIYLPINITIVLVLGGLISYWVHRNLARTGDENYQSQQSEKGTLFASGLIVGETIIGIMIAACIVFSGNSYPLRLVSDDFALTASILGAVVFILLCGRCYRATTR